MWLTECGLSSDSFNVDHVIPESLGGRGCIYNAHFMPSGTNAHFNNMAIPRMDEEWIGGCVLNIGDNVGIPVITAPSFSVFAWASENRKKCNGHHPLEQKGERRKGRFSSFC